MDSNPKDLQDLIGFHLIIFGFLKKPKIRNPLSAENKNFVKDNFLFEAEIFTNIAYS